MANESASHYWCTGSLDQMCSKAPTWLWGCVWSTCSDGRGLRVARRWVVVHCALAPLERQGSGVVAHVLSSEALCVLQSCSSPHYSHPERSRAWLECWMDRLACSRPWVEGREGKRKGRKCDSSMQSSNLFLRKDHCYLVHLGLEAYHSEISFYIKMDL
jgi:hypothetical protein